jgi:hypothetical protein
MALDDIGVDQAFVDACCNYTEDLDLSIIDGVSVRASAIHGVGCFSDCEIVKAGGVVGKGSNNGHRTLLGRYTNHSCDPNCEAKCVGCDLYIVAKRDIEFCEELTLDYRQSFMEARKLCLAQ